MQKFIESHHKESPIPTICELFCRALDDSDSQHLEGLWCDFDIRHIVFLFACNLLHKTIW